MANEIFNYRQKYHKLSEDISLMEYLKEARGLTEETINRYSLGTINIRGFQWITIPLFNSLGEFIDGYKLRAIPWDLNNKNRYIHYPKGVLIDCPFNGYNLDHSKNKIIICEGEFDCMLLNQFGYNAITSVTGVQSFKDSYFEFLKPFSEITILFDNDEAGVKAAKSLAEKLALKFPSKQISIAKIPKEEGVKDVTDYFVKYKEIEKVIENRTKYKGIDVQSFSEIGLEDIKNALDIIVKGDDKAKIMAFLGVVSTYVPNSQLNISMTGPSSTGKTYITNAVTKIMPQEDLITIQYASPKAFFHEEGEYDKDNNAIIVTLDRKCLFFVDQPSLAILEVLRPILSHDKKEIVSKITDKNAKGGNSTKNVIIVGFPSVFFCTVSLRMDEQESTRLIMLSPEVNEEKIRDGVRSVVFTEEKQDVEEATRGLRERLLAIKYQEIAEVRLTYSQKAELFTRIGKMKASFIPRDMRDADKIKSLIYSISVLNFPHRKLEDSILYANDSDVEQALLLWHSFFIGQSYDLPPYLMEVFGKVYIPLFKEKGNISDETISDEMYLEKAHISKKFASVFKRALRHKEFIESIQMFESIDFIEIGNHALDGRKQTYKLSSEGKNYILRREGGIQ
jgi:5S rRNA maturation endonuclease (ribonuclease M5)